MSIKKIKAPDSRRFGRAPGLKAASPCGNPVRPQIAYLNGIWLSKMPLDRSTVYCFSWTLWQGAICPYVRHEPYRIALILSYNFKYVKYLNGGLYERCKNNPSVLREGLLEVRRLGLFLLLAAFLLRCLLCFFLCCHSIKGLFLFFWVSDHPKVCFIYERK